MSTLTIMFVRRAEKPGGAFPGPGTTLEGKDDDKSLVVRGWQRGGAWAALFAAGHPDYPPANVVYAAARHRFRRKRTSATARSRPPDRLLLASPWICGPIFAPARRTNSSLS